METVEIVELPMGTAEIYQMIETSMVTIPTPTPTVKKKTSWLQLSADDIDFEKLPKAKLLSLVRLLIHYKYMLNFVDRHFLVGGVQSILNTAVPQFRSDLQKCEEEYVELTGLATFMRNFEDCWRRYRGDIDKVYVTAAGDVREIDWEAVSNTHSREKREARKRQTDEELIAQKKAKKDEKMQNLVDKINGVKRTRPSRIIRQKQPEPIKIEHAQTTSEIETVTNQVANLVTEYHCPYHLACRFKASSMDIIEGHVQRFHINSQLISCQYLYCFQMFESQEQLNEHLVNFHGPKGGVVRRNFRQKFTPIPCPVVTCDEVLISKMKLKWHLFRKHRAEYMHCTRCDKQYAQRKNLCRHVRTVHKDLSEEEKLAILLVNDKENDEEEEDDDEEEEEEEEEDEETAEGTNNVWTGDVLETGDEGFKPAVGPKKSRKKKKKTKTREGRYSKVTDSQEYRCIIEDCQAVYIKESDLRAHLLTDHPDISLKCQFCGQFCGDHKKMYYHHYYHHREGRHVCKELGCNFECKLFIDMKKHNNTYHARLSPCTVEGCSAMVSYSHRNKHRREVHGIPTEKRYSCSWPECIKKFTSATKLKSHMRTHLNLKRYGCLWPECGYRSEQKETVVVHIRVCHFKLPRTVREQKEKNIVVDQNPYDWVEALPEDVIVNV